MSKNQWTAFWKSLDITTVKRTRTIKNYRPNTDFNSLKRNGVDQNTLDAVFGVISTSKKYKDELFFNKLSRFFRRDSLTIQNWLKASSKSQAFSKLFNIIHKSNIIEAKSRLNEINLVFKYFRKQEGRKYNIAVKAGTNVELDTKRLVLNLNRKDKNSRYSQVGVVQIKNDKIYSIKKKSPSIPDVFKFIKISQSGKNVEITIVMDSNFEYGISKLILEKCFDVILDSKNVNRSLNNWNKFLTTGISKHFKLAGASLIEDEFKLSFSTLYNRQLNLLNSRTYKNKIVRENRKAETISQVKLLYNDKRSSRPLYLSILSYRNAGIIGAIKIQPDGKKMSIIARKELYSLFKQDFKLPLNEFISYNDLNRNNIFKILLEKNPQIIRIDLRSPLALGIYQELLTEKLLTNSSLEEEQTKFCVNSICSNKFYPVWGISNCNTCGDVLLNGKNIVTQSVNESSVVDFIKSKLTLGNVDKLTNKLLRRNIYVAKVEYDNEFIEVIPLNSQLPEHSVEVLKFRFPNLLIVGNGDWIEDLKATNINVMKLHDLVVDLLYGKGKTTNKIFDKILENKHHRSKTIAKSALERLQSDGTYREYNKKSKYLGAEIFEADCSAIFNYTIGNTLWLGAKMRGKSLPDGFTAFPLMNSQEGCLIWDGKFGEGSKIQMGKFDKNKKYIESAKKNASIKENGGLKGFVFVSNKKFPANFESKYKTVIGRKMMKLTFLNSTQLVKLTKVYMRNEKKISENINARQEYIAILKKLYITYDKSKCEVIKDSVVDKSIKEFSAKIKAMVAGNDLTV